MVADIDAHALKPDDAKTSRGLRVCATGLALPFGDRCCDAITCLDVIEHVERDQSLLCELGRVLKVGGILLVSTPRKEFGLPFVCREWLNARWGHVRNGYTRDDLTAKLHGAGFTVRRLGTFFGLWARGAYTLLFIWRLHYLLPGGGRSLFRVVSRLDKRWPWRQREWWALCVKE